MHTPQKLDIEDFPSVRDKKDSPILATAMMEDVDILVTGDMDLLVVEIDYPEVMTMREFIKKH